MCNYECKITNKFLFVCCFYVKLCDFVFTCIRFLCIYKKANKLKTCSLYVGVDGFEPPTLCL